MQRIKEYFKQISLADKCLLIIFTICLFQTFLMLFLNENNTQTTNTIDIIVRTTAAGIFGYLLSSNFHLRTPEQQQNINTYKTPPQIKTSQKQSVTSMKTSIGFTPEASAPDSPDLGFSDENNIQNLHRSRHVQSLIATVIGITALCILLVIRNFITITPEMISTISQLRDFVSGCVGFLLGTQTNSASH